MYRFCQFVSLGVYPISVLFKGKATQVHHSFRKTKTIGLPETRESLL